MSGGHFNYKQHSLEYDIIEKLEEAIQNLQDTEHYHYVHLPLVREKFFEALVLIRSAKVYIDNIDYLLCGDTGEDTFIDRLNTDLNKLKDELDQFEKEHIKHEKSNNV